SRIDIDLHAHANGDAGALLGGVQRRPRVRQLRCGARRRACAVAAWHFGLRGQPEPRSRRGRAGLRVTSALALCAATVQRVLEEPGEEAEPWVGDRRWAEGWGA